MRTQIGGGNLPHAAHKLGVGWCVAHAFARCRAGEAAGNQSSQAECHIARGVSPWLTIYFNREWLMNNSVAVGLQQ